MAPVFQSTLAGSGSDAMASKAVAVAALAPTIMSCVARTPSRSRLRALTRLSDGPIDCVEVAWLHENAIFPKLKFGNVRKQTLRQHYFKMFIFCFEELLLVGVAPQLELAEVAVLRTDGYRNPVVI